MPDLGRSGFNSIDDILSVLPPGTSVEVDPNGVLIVTASEISELVSLSDWARRLKDEEQSASFADSTVSDVPSKITRLPDWILSFSGSSKQEPTTSELASLLADLEKCARAGDLRLIDHVLEQLDAESFHETVLVAILRITFPLRQSLANWVSFRERVADELSNRQLDTDRVLRGLR